MKFKYLDRVKVLGDDFYGGTTGTVVNYSMVFPDNQALVKIPRYTVHLDGGELQGNFFDAELVKCKNTKAKRN